MERFIDFDAVTAKEIMTSEYTEAERRQWRDHHDISKRELEEKDDPFIQGFTEGRK